MQRKGKGDRKPHRSRSSVQNANLPIRFGTEEEGGTDSFCINKGELNERIK
jgi:hypothetical protein